MEEEFNAVDCCDRCLAEGRDVEICSEECGVECRDLYDVDEEFWGEIEGEEEEEWW
jgi:hypothetical protein